MFATLLMFFSTMASEFRTFYFLFALPVGGVF